jgi:CubicO group peptidase (beta-lactamase class C family)
MMTRISCFALLLSIRLMAQGYDFSAATSQLESNLGVYGNRVVVIVEQRELGEIFRYQSGAITQDSKIGIASCTKWLSGAVVLASAERGYLHLDDRVGDYLPVLESNGKGDITIRQCFGMKSGLSLRDPDYEIDRTLTLAESVDLIAANAPIVFPPGTQLDYEGDGMQVVGRICEVATGKDWRVLARELLFDPLAMDIADYLFFGINPGIAGGARCSAADYLKFLHMVIQNGQGANGRVVLSSSSVQEFFTNQTFGLPEYYSPARESDYYAYDERPNYGMGSWVIARNPATGVVEEVASPGAFGTYPWVDRRRGLRGIIFMLGIGAVAIESNLRVLAHLRTEIDLKGLPPPGPPGPVVTNVVDHHLKLSWDGGGMLETSPDLNNWTLLLWASSPFLESLERPPAVRLFYRVAR